MGLVLRLGFGSGQTQAIERLEEPGSLARGPGPDARHPADPELLTVLDGRLAGKSWRETAVELYGAQRVAADWNADSWMRSRERRRGKKARILMEVATGIGWPGGNGRGEPRTAPGSAMEGSFPEIAKTTHPERCHFLLGNSTCAPGSLGARAEKENGMRYARMFYSTRHVADWLGISPRTLEGYRITGKGPVFHRFGCLVRYLGADVYIWVAAQRRISTTDEGEALRVAVRWQRRKPPWWATGEGDASRNPLGAS